MSAPVHITFLGGLGQIGRNCAALEVDGQVLLIDCGQRDSPQRFEGFGEGRT